MLADTVIDEFDFASVPKIALEGGEQNLSAMIRGDMKDLETAAFCRMLGKKNDGFRGKLKLVSSKLFTGRDKTKNGQSMEGWRLLELKGDDEFMRSLEGFEANHRFKIGGGWVIIRGGNRKPPGPTGANAEPMGGQGGGGQGTNQSGAEQSTPGPQQST